MKNNQQTASRRSRAIAFCAMSIALMTVSAWVTIPFGPVPFTLQTLAVMFVVFSLKPAWALSSIAGYLALGALGAPVFASFKGGLAALLGPTGGFIVGFLVAAALALLVRETVLSRFVDDADGQRVLFGVSVGKAAFAANMVTGVLFLAVLYVFGWAWLMYIGGLSAEAAFLAAVLPFIPIDIAKMIGASVLASAVGAALRMAAARG